MLWLLWPDGKGEAVQLSSPFCRSVNKALFMCFLISYMWNRYCYLPHFVSEGVRNRKVVICWGSHSWVLLATSFASSLIPASVGSRLLFTDQWVCKCSPAMKLSLLRIAHRAEVTEVRIRRIIFFFFLLSLFLLRLHFRIICIDYCKLILPSQTIPGISNLFKRIVHLLRVFVYVICLVICSWK